MSAGGCSALVPVKPLTEALGRLSHVLDGPRRRALQAAMLADVLDACTHASHVEETFVVTNDPGAARVASTFGARVVNDHVPPRGVNPAVALGVDHLARIGTETVLVLMADLPQVTSTALDDLVVASRGWAVTLAPSSNGTGTNAMVVRPPQAIAAQMGLGSLARHQAAARLVGVSCQTVSTPALAVDVDHPDDLLAVVASGDSGLEFARAWRVVGMGRSLGTAASN